jgi:hypothetical protein
MVDDPPPRITGSRSIWNVTTRWALWLVTEMSPNTMVEKIVTAKFQPSVKNQDRMAHGETGRDEHRAADQLDRRESD